MPEWSNPQDATTPAKPLASWYAQGLSAGLGGISGIWDSIVHDFSNIGSPTALAAFGQVLMR